MGWMKGLLLLWVCVASLRPAFGSTDPRDAAALRSLASYWKNTPPSWGQTNDPCGTKWDGVICNDLRVTTLKLFSMGLEGTLSSDIGNLTELRTLDLSYNPKLGGTLTPAIGDLKKLESLSMIGCNFDGRIPDELGNLSYLQFLFLNLNKFSGEIPASLGRLSNLLWLDLGDNQLTGSLPVSTDDAPGLNQLLKAEHFHLNNNQFSGPIPENLFNSSMRILHVLLDGNRLNGTIPKSIGLVKTLTDIRLDNNILSGPVPSNITDLPSLAVLHLANNSLNGSMPDLTGMNSLTYVDLSNNSFDPSEAPAWFSSLQNLTTLVIKFGRLHGEVPQKLFSLPNLQKVTLSNNAFNGTLDLGNNISRQLQEVDFRNNDLVSVTLSSNYTDGIILVGNPVCSNTLLASYCQLQQKQPHNTANCSHPYEGGMIFRAPFFYDMKHYQTDLEESIRKKLNIVHFRLEGASKWCSKDCFRCTFLKCRVPKEAEDILII